MLYSFSLTALLSAQPITGYAASGQGTLPQFYQVVRVPTLASERVARTHTQRLSPPSRAEPSQAPKFRPDLTDHACLGHQRVAEMDHLREFLLQVLASTHVTLSSTAPCTELHIFHKRLVPGLVLWFKIVCLHELSVLCRVLGC